MTEFTELLAGCFRNVIIKEKVPINKCYFINWNTIQGFDPEKNTHLSCVSISDKKQCRERERERETVSLFTCSLISW